MNEQEQLCKEFGGLTDDQAREKLYRMGIIIRTISLDPKLHKEKEWRREVVRLCDYPKERFARKLLTPKPIPVFAGDFQESGYEVFYQEYKMLEMGYAHWVDNNRLGEPGNGYFIHYRWFYWVKNGEPKPMFG